MKTRVIYIFTALVNGPTPNTNAYAQLGMKASLCNNHLWGGMEVSDGCVLTADAFYTSPNGLFTLGLWGGTNTQGTYKEFNHHLSFQKNGCQLALWDTYNFSPGATYNNREYFNYSARTTGRFLDATFSYRFQSKVPLLLSWSTIVFGRDRNADNTANKYSTFVYAEYPVYQNLEWRCRCWGRRRVCTPSCRRLHTLLWDDRRHCACILARVAYIEARWLSVASSCRRIVESAIR